MDTSKYLYLKGLKLVEIGFFFSISSPFFSHLLYLKCVTFWWMLGARGDCIPSSNMIPTFSFQLALLSTFSVCSVCHDDLSIRSLTTFLLTDMYASRLAKDAKMSTAVTMCIVRAWPWVTSARKSWRVYLFYVGSWQGITIVTYFFSDCL